MRHKHDIYRGLNRCPNPLMRPALPASPALLEWASAALVPLAPPTSMPGITLWLVDLDTEFTWGSEAPLNAQEQERAERFRFELHARRYRASHVAMRLILAQIKQCDPAALAFTEGAHGKPRLVCDAPLHFNMSHSAGWALVGVCPSHPIGVDLELIVPMDDAPLLAQKNFTASEYAAFQGTPPDQRLHAFFRCWTRKEACLKALGSGLSIEPHAFEAGLVDRPQDTFIEVDGQPCHMSVAGIDLPMPALAAVAALTDAGSPLAM